MMVNLLASHNGFHDDTLMFVMALASLILGVIALVLVWHNVPHVVLAAGLTLVGLALTIAWWPA